MTQQEREWFSKLAADRADSARVFMKPSNIGVWRAIIDKYSDQAHFIYELLQNADDAGATKAEFVLEKHMLLFKHNGTRRFSITSPETEFEDFENGRIGDLNSITGAGGFSTKRAANEEGNAIGKFGVGFKAVFQYTTSPEIYDEGIAFRLDNYIVPVIIDSDNPRREKGETLFVFPLDRDGIKDPRGEIWKKLNTLLFPTLFLNNLKSIVFSDGSDEGEYKVITTKSFKGSDFEARKIIVRSKTANGANENRMWLFTRTDDGNNKYSVGYMVDGTGKLTPVDYKAFCYFPTKHETKLKFIIHAPFLLTDSRESIKDGVEHNIDMIEKLALLATAGLKFLCERQKEEKQRIVDDDVIKVIPIKCEDYDDGISFDQFRREFKYLFMTEEVIPTKDGFTRRENAYWPQSYELGQLFSDAQLNDILDEEHERQGAMRWVFASFPQKRKSINQLDYYVYNFIEECIDETVFEKQMITAISGGFIERQTREWLLSFYKWIAGNDARMDAAKTVPIFLDQKGEACAAFNDDGRRNLFLPLEGETRYHFVNEEIRKNPAVQKIINYYKLERPDMADYIDLVIRERLDDATPEESDMYLKQIFEYYVKLPTVERRSLIESLAGKIRLRCVDLGGGCVAYPKIVPPLSYLYFPTDDIKAWFEESQSSVRLVDDKYYLEQVGHKLRDELFEFLESVGVKYVPALIEHTMPKAYNRLYSYIILTEHNIDYRFHTCAEAKRDREVFRERWVDAGNLVLDRIISAKDFGKKKSLSILLWRVLCRCAKVYQYNESYTAVEGCERNFLSGTHEYEHYGRGKEAFDSPFLLYLRRKKWLVVSDFDVKAPNETAVSELPGWYERIDGSTELIAALRMRYYTVDDLEHRKVIAAREALSDEDKKNRDLGEIARRLGLTEEDLKQAKADKERRASLERSAADHQRTADDSRDNGDDHSQESEVFKSDDAEERPSCTMVKKPSSGSVMANIELRVEKLRENAKSDISIVRAEDEDDEDEITPKTIDFEKRIRDRESKQANEIAVLEKGDELQKAALQHSKYSFGWFKAMLGLEMLGMEDDASSQREITVTFTKMVKEVDSERTYTLKHPSRNLPQWIEELTDVPLDMLVGKRNLRPRIEAMSVKSFDLRVKFKQDEKLDGIDLTELKEAKISVQRPDFLLTSLRDGLELLPFADDKDLRNDLTERIEFVFGPPGTGKTTFLADKRIKNLMYRSPGQKVLVLAPTNKAADVLASRVISCFGDDESCRQWLVRFGATSDENLEKSGIVCGKSVDIGKMERCCVVATIARFPYDKYVPGNAEPTKIEEVDWDYIIIDEASMIPLVYMVYVLYRKSKSAFIIAGDPFQIDPIVKNAGWEEENIYKMVGLKDFANPNTAPKAYPVTKLTTQYRSLPCIGEIFSRYRYGGVLAHARTMREKGNLSLQGLGRISPLLIVKFPVSSYESIYSLKRLKHGLKGGSPYQIYSAIFTFELVFAIARRRVRDAERRVFRIGIISPYKAQADLVQSLIESEDIPLDAEIVSSTVHGFQGDECDMIIALFNPPPGIAGGRRMFINHENIVNVAISRARDYLVLVMPDDDTPRLENMTEVRKIETAMLDANPKADVVSASSLEKWMFNTETYIEDNSFSSGHQSVNVYGDPERRYEVRSEETAIDIQIHKPKVNDRSEKVNDRPVDAFNSVRQTPANSSNHQRDKSGTSIKRERGDFFSFLDGRVMLSVATMKAEKYCARYYVYREIKESGDEHATEEAYQLMRNAAGFFYAHYCEYRKTAKSAPSFKYIMREIVRRLDEHMPLW